ncbi:hypothetical protein SEA_ARCHERNM_68 [Mycobacterium phage ArcherNM]|uniref:hypothetical protein n=1 Tax=Mycobacterium phage ArcherNM TaxID=1815972 RepID=UPI00078D48F7|nr:hypothetical protein BJD71_gp68 [Mycobacterium phage ArcherNM]AMS01062.1 hypothetical protein SEA_ARCHERNM_68 [Mycobacterium phage ArcherNM]
MALSRITALFPEVVSNPVETIVLEPLWLYAQKCEVWWQGLEHLDPVTILLTYRSPLVKDTSKMYRPVSKLILESKRFEVISAGSQVDSTWWGEKGEFMVARMTQASEFPGGPLDMTQVRDTINQNASAALSQVLAAA